MLEDEEFFLDWVIFRIIGVKNLFLGVLEKFISFFYIGYIVIMKFYIIWDLLKLVVILYVEKLIKLFYVGDNVVMIKFIMRGSKNILMC